MKIIKRNYQNRYGRNVFLSGMRFVMIGNVKQLGIFRVGIFKLKKNGLGHFNGKDPA